MQDSLGNTAHNHAINLQAAVIKIPFVTIRIYQTEICFRVPECLLIYSSGRGDS